MYEGACHLRNASTELEVCPQYTLPVVGTLVAKKSPRYQPADFEPHSGVDQAVEIAVGVLESQSIGIYEILFADKDVKFRGQVHEVGLGWSDSRDLGLEEGIHNTMMTVSSLMW